MKRKTIITFVALLLTAFGFLAPVIPVPLETGMWESAELKAEMPKINDFMTILRERSERITPAKEESSFYRLTFKSGTTDIKRSLFGTSSTGRRSEMESTSHLAFVPPGIPQMLYHEDEKTAQLTPENYDAFVDWIEDGSDSK